MKCYSASCVNDLYCRICMRCIECAIDRFDCSCTLCQSCHGHMSCKVCMQNGEDTVSGPESYDLRCGSCRMRRTCPICHKCHHTRRLWFEDDLHQNKDICSKHLMKYLFISFPDTTTLPNHILKRIESFLPYNMLENIYSGGALGADTKWYEYFQASESVKFNVVLCYGMKFYHPKGMNVHLHILNEEEELYAKDKVEEARKSLGIAKFDNISPYLLRDYYQITDVEAVFAVGTLGKRKGVRVNGGTGYTCQMYRNLCLERGIDCNLYLWDMNESIWKRWNEGNLDWIDAHSPDLNQYHNIACIGSREFDQPIDSIL